MTDIVEVWTEGGWCECCHVNIENHDHKDGCLVPEIERLRETIRMMDEGKNADVRGLKMVEDMEAEIERLRAALTDRNHLYNENHRLRAALRSIAQPTYGTELWMSDGEIADVYWTHIKRFQHIARKALGDE